MKDGCVAAADALLIQFFVNQVFSEMFILVFNHSRQEKERLINNVFLVMVLLLSSILLSASRTMRKKWEKKTPKFSSASSKERSLRSFLLP